MAGRQDFVDFYDDFLGARTLTAAASENDPWEITITGAGPPTTTIGGINGLATLAHSTDVQIQNVCMAFEDDLNFDIDLLQSVEYGVSLGQATMDSTSMSAWGVASARNDVIDTLAEQALFRVIGTSANVVVETDDGTNNNDDVATGTTLGTTQKKFFIDFNSKADVKFYIDGDRVAQTTTFDMSNYSDGVQPYFQIQKTSDSNADSLIIDYVHIVSRRAL